MTRDTAEYLTMDRQLHTTKNYLAPKSSVLETLV